MPKGVHENHIRSSAHYRWNNKKIISTSGYAKIRVGRTHPLADPNGYAYEHLIVWCAAGNERPASNEILHHKNGNKFDNRIENIEKVLRGSHNMLHNASRSRSKNGRFQKSEHNELAWVMSGDHS